MKIKIIFATLFLLPFIVAAHPIKMSLLYIEYEPDNKTVYMECRLFGDDLSMAIEEEMGTKIRLGYWSDLEQDLINKFIKKHIKVSFGDQVYNLEYYDGDYNKSNNVVTLKYQFASIVLNAGEKITMSNDLFFKQFTYAQTNVFDLQIPKVAETTIECSMNNYTKTFTVKK